MTSAIPYHRFSSAQQDAGSSLERQREITAETIIRNGWTSLPAVEDRAKSAFHGDHLRGELGNLTSRILAGDYPTGTVIVAERIDRLSRQGYDALTAWMKLVTGAGLKVFTCDDSKVYDATNIASGMEGMMVRLIKAEVARDYVESMRDRVITGIRSRQTKARDLGRPTSLRKDTFDNLPGWLEWKEGQVIVIEVRAEVVRDIYRWSADGLGSAVNRPGFPGGRLV